MNKELGAQIMSRILEQQPISNESLTIKLTQYLLLLKVKACKSDLSQEAAEHIKESIIQYVEMLASKQGTTLGPNVNLLFS